jgi:hypothetical protein
LEPPAAKKEACCRRRRVVLSSVGERVGRDEVSVRYWVLKRR